MCYLVTGLNSPLASGARANVREIFDTETEAKAKAEEWLKIGITEVAVWKQVAAPSIETTINWEPKNAAKV